MDRPFVYDGALPQTIDILNTNLFGMIAQAYQNAGVLGTSTVVAGLACTPTTPTANLIVNVAPGSIYSLDAIDAIAYGDLGINSNIVVKQGIVQISTPLTITPPSTSGFSQVYLIQVELSDVDAGSSVLSYFNSANPAAPFSGPANSGGSNFTVRQCVCTIGLKAGVAAATGSQTTPSPDAGFTALYAITVANGQTQITSTSIALLSTAPFFPTLPSVQGHTLKGDWVWGTDTGAANAYIITIPQAALPVTAYVAGFTFRAKFIHANSGASTINVNGFGTVAIQRAGGAAVITGDILAGMVLELTYDGANFQIANYPGQSTGAITNNFNSINIPYIADSSGVANAITANFSPSITSGQQIAGLLIMVKLANNITAATTINVSSLGNKNVTYGNLSALTASNFTAGELLLLAYDGTEYQVIASLSTGGGSPGATGPQGAAGAAGPAGPQGPAGTFPLTPGAIGTYATSSVNSFLASTYTSAPAFASGGQQIVFNYNNSQGNGGPGNWPGTWQIVSQFYLDPSQPAFVGDNFPIQLVQRIA
jgi:hypothetical protein